MYFCFNCRFPSYAIFSDSEVSSLASRTNTRYSVNSLFGLMFDVTVLSECDYMVCTFSSQVNIMYEENSISKDNFPVTRLVYDLKTLIQLLFFNILPVH